MQIIVIDPVPTTSQLLQYVLTEAGHDVIVVQRGADALRAVEEHEPAAILLESRLPDMDGTTLCKELRARQYVGPVIFVSAENVVGAKVEAFTHGADDFIVRRYDPAELIARVAAVVRRCRPATIQAQGTVLRVGDVALSLGDLTVRVGNRPPVLLTPTEMRLLECLMRNQRLTISRETLIARTWGYDFVGESNRVDVYVSRLRKKLERNPAEPEYLHTVRGVGYVFRPARRADVVELDPALLGSEVAASAAEAS